MCVRHQVVSLSQATFFARRELVPRSGWCPAFSNSGWNSSRVLRPGYRKRRRSGSLMNSCWVRVTGCHVEFIRKSFENGTLGSAEVGQGITRNGQCAQSMLGLLKFDRADCTWTLPSTNLSGMITLRSDFEYCLREKATPCQLSPTWRCGHSHGIRMWLL